MSFELVEILVLGVIFALGFAIGHRLTAWWLDCMVEAK